MKSSLLPFCVVLLGAAPLQLHSQTPTPNATVIERGLNHQVLSNVSYRTNEATGEIQARTNRYTQLAPGLHYRAADGSLQETKEVIKPVPGGAVAQEGPARVAFALNANTRGAIRYESDGGEVLESHALCLMMGDGTGQWVTLGVVKDAQGQVTAPNVVTYADAFTGLKADLRYTYRRDSFEQDIIIREQVDPAAYGLDPKTTIIQVITEWVDYPGKAVLAERDNPFSRAEPLNVLQMKLGAVRFGPGRAFAEPQPAARAGVPPKRIAIQKRFARLNGRDCLIEQATYADLKPLMERLPKAQAALPKAGANRVANLAAALPPSPVKMNIAVPSRRMEIAMAGPVQPNGLVLDYYTTIASDLDNYTFTNGTYLISSAIYLTGTNTFQPGAILKFDGWGSLYTFGSIIWPDQPDNPVVFTSQYDNELGEEVATGDPTNSYGYALVNETTGLNVRNARFRYAQVPIDTSFEDTAFVTCTNVIFEQALFGILGNSAGGRLFNVLFLNVTYAVYFSGTGSAEQVTAHLCDVFDYCSTISLTNSLLVEVGWPNLLATNHVVILDDDTGVFETGPLGNHYLAAGQTNLINQGNTNAAAVGLYHYTTSTNQTPESSSTVDLGFHYVALNASGTPLDADGDGLPNYAEDSNGNGQFDQGETDLNDYYNGTLPQLSVNSGNQQTGHPSNWLAQPLVVLVRNGSSQPLADAPITLAVTTGGGGLATSTNGTPTNSLAVRTDANGLAAAWMKLPGGYNATNTVTAIAQSGTSSNTVAFSEYNIQQVATPSLSPDGGRFSLSKTVTIACATTGASLYYTLDGTEPTQSEYRLVGSTVMIWRASVLKVKAFKTGIAPSETKTATFLITGSIAASGLHSLAGSSAGDLKAWGQGTYGQLGHGTNKASNMPVTPLGLAGVGKISGGINHSISVKSDGTVWAWGLNSSGQLGDGTNTTRYAPVQTINLSNAVEVAAGWTHSLAITATGTVQTWGNNSNGKLGDGTTTGRYAPVQVTNLTNAVQAAGGANHSLALKNDGTAWAWGLNSSGQLGDGTTTNRYAPVSVANLSNLLHVAAGANHSLAVKNDGTVWAWGQNTSWQLGDGTLTNRSIPVRAGNISNVVGVAAGQSHSLALKADGTVWGWGYNTSGQLGDGTTITRSNLVQVAGLSNVLTIAAGLSHSLALRADGTLWAWGAGNYGQLGNGASTNSSVPVQVRDLCLLNLDDADGDGLAAWRELELGTNPDLADTDYDGVNDGQEVADNKNPLDAADVTLKSLGYWKFDTSAFLGEQGQVPIWIGSTVSNAPSWSSNALATTASSWSGVRYRDLETNGTANINCRNGTVRFWFKPNWSGTNAGGTGPGTWGRFLELGYYSYPHLGEWQIHLNPEGTVLTFSSSTNGTGTWLFSAEVNWVSNVWHQVAVTYTPTNTALYLDGTLTTTGAGVQYYPSAALRAYQGMNVGFGNDGSWVNGQFEELETFNYPLSESEIGTGYLDSDADGLPDVMETGLGTNPNNADTDGDGLSDYQEYYFGGNPAQAASPTSNETLQFKVFTPLD